MVNEVPAFSRSRTRGSTIRRDRGDEARVPSWDTNEEDTVTVAGIGKSVIIEL